MPSNITDKLEYKFQINPLVKLTSSTHAKDTFVKHHDIGSIKGFQTIDLNKYNSSYEFHWLKQDAVEVTDSHDTFFPISSWTYTDGAAYHYAHYLIGMYIKHTGSSPEPLYFGATVNTSETCLLLESGESMFLKFGNTTVDDGSTNEGTGLRASIVNASTTSGNTINIDIVALMRGL